MAKYLARRRQELYNVMFRVDHSGELAADRIHWALMYCFRNDPEMAPKIQHMWEQEKRHLEYFSKQLVLNRGRKSYLTPVWEVASLTLGAGAGMMGRRAAMAATVAVESTISEHYDQQIRTLIRDDLTVHRPIITELSQIRDEEQEHHDLGMANEAELAPGYRFLNSIISNGCKVAIQIAQRW